MESHRTKKETRRLANPCCLMSDVLVLHLEPSFFPVPHFEANSDAKSVYWEIWVYNLLEKSKAYCFVLSCTLDFICRTYAYYDFTTESPVLIPLLSTSFTSHPTDFSEEKKQKKSLAIIIKGIRVWCILIPRAIWLQNKP